MTDSIHAIVDGRAENLTLYRMLNARNIKGEPVEYDIELRWETEVIFADFYAVFVEHCKSQRVKPPGQNAIKRLLEPWGAGTSRRNDRRLVTLPHPSDALQFLRRIARFDELVGPAQIKYINEEWKSELKEERPSTDAYFKKMQASRDEFVGPWPQWNMTNPQPASPAKFMRLIRAGLMKDEEYFDHLRMIEVEIRRLEEELNGRVEAGMADRKRWRDENMRKARQSFKGTNISPSIPELEAYHAEITADLARFEKQMFDAHIQPLIDIVEPEPEEGSDFFRDIP